MFLIEKISNRLAYKIAYTLDLDSNQEQIIAYGAINAIQAIWCIFLVGIFGFIFNVLVYAFIISFTVSLLRKYSGGVHAFSPNKCSIIGTVISVGFAVVIKYIGSLLNVKGVIFVGLLDMAFSYFLIYKLAPVDSPNKPIINIEIKQRMKRNSIMIIYLLGTVIIMLLIMYLNIKKQSLLVASMCIYTGILWQSITLTSKCHLIFRWIDKY